MNNPDIGLVHRIDKDTSGLLLIAKTPEAKAHLAKQFFDHTTERTYNALVWGTFKEDSGTIEGALARDNRDRARGLRRRRRAAGRGGACGGHRACAGFAWV
jgi:23S rRNA pseudouridine1911/1915/1917 synthase